MSRFGFGKVNMFDCRACAFKGGQTITIEGLTASKIQELEV